MSAPVFEALTACFARFGDGVLSSGGVGVVRRDVTVSGGESARFSVGLEAAPGTDMTSAIRLGVSSCLLGTGFADGLREESFSGPSQRILAL